MLHLDSSALVKRYADEVGESLDSAESLSVENPLSHPDLDSHPRKTGSSVSAQSAPCMSLIFDF